MFGEAALEAEYGRRIRLLREAYGLSKPEIAARLGISEARYRRFEERGRMPAYLAPKLCQIYDVELERFLDFGLPFDVAPSPFAQKDPENIEQLTRRPFRRLRSSR
jgi:transcriptional regulator with XRE-family HTH domain